MSDALYATRLRWANGHGSARHDGVHVELRSRPSVLMHIARLAELEYTPEVGIQYAQAEGCRRRDLERGEALEFQAWLERMADGARSSMGPRWD